MLKDPDAGIVHYTTVRNIETGELVNAWPFSDIEDADQRRKEECLRKTNDLLTVA